MQPVCLSQLPLGSSAATSPSLAQRHVWASFSFSVLLPALPWLLCGLSWTPHSSFLQSPVPVTALLCLSLLTQPRLKHCTELISQPVPTALHELKHPLQLYPSSCVAPLSCHAKKHHLGAWHIIFSPSPQLPGPVLVPAIDVFIAASMLSLGLKRKSPAGPCSPLECSLG